VCLSPVRISVYDEVFNTNPRTRGNTRKVLSSLHRKSANSSTKLHHSISTLLPKMRTRRKLFTWRAMFPVRVYTVQLLRVLDPQNEDSTILQNMSLFACPTGPNILRDFRLHSNARALLHFVF